MSWAELLLVFLRAAFLSANGSTTLALLEQDLVTRLQVLTPRDFAAGVAIGSASPGPLGYGCIALGFLADGWRGALVATFTSWLPAFLAVPVRAAYLRVQRRPWIHGVSWGVAASGTGLLLAMVVGLLGTAVTGWKELLVVGGALALLRRGLPVAAVLALAAAAGTAWLR